MQSITRRWLRGSLLITICILAAALGLFLYYSHQNLYGGVQRAMQARFPPWRGVCRQPAPPAAARQRLKAAASPCAARWNSLMKR